LSRFFSGKKNKISFAGIILAKGNVKKDLGRRAVKIIDTNLKRI
jgi:hypothetical protein